MRLISSRESYDQNEISAIAIAETLLSVAIAIYLGSIVGGYLYLILWSAIGWTLLLRTEESMIAGANAYEYFYSYGYNVLCRVNDATASALRKAHPRFGGVISIYLMWLIVPVFMIYAILLSIAVKSITTIAFLCAAPVLSFKAVPVNWMQAALSLDAGVSPELVPGLRKYIIDDPIRNSMRESSGIGPTVRLFSLDYKLLFLELSYFWPWCKMVLAILVALPLLCGYVNLFTIFLVIHSVALAAQSPLRALFWLPIFTYRVSLKSISIFYIYILATIQQATSSALVSVQYNYLRNGAYSHLKRVAAWLILIFLFGKILLYSIGVNMADSWNHLVAREFLTVYIAPYSIPGWQLASAISALLSIGMYYFADYANSRHLKGSDMDDETLLWTLRTVVILTGILGAYSIASNIYIIASHPPFIKWPKIRPWIPE